MLVAGGGAAAAIALAACGSSDKAETPAAPATSAAQAQAGQPLVAVDQVPLGGGVVIPDPAIVVTQPDTGDYKAFTAICPHQGCLVNEVMDNEIVCPCHGSRFSAADGSVLAGPATEGLAAEPITVQGTQISLS